MSDAWRGLDLGGGGLQAANIRLAQGLKRRSRAYGLLAAFPLGLHRAYLDDRRGAWAYRVASLAGVGALLLDWRAAALLGLALLGAAAYDLFWIDRRVTLLNKAIRKRVYLSQTAGPPPGFRGRTIDEPGAAPRPLSFAEQERLLRAMARDRGAPPARGDGEASGGA
ncbi:MAG: TM2 domain-containing protein [Burkholderiales bacterium]|nr:TM2 domain-containing protein [Burkholderiales bacterium]